MVVHRITKKEILIADPSRGITKYIPEEFFKIWTGVLILLVPTTQFKRGDNAKGIFARFLMLLKPQKKLLLNIFFASLIYIQSLGFLVHFILNFYLMTFYNTIWLKPYTLSRLVLYF